MTSTPQVTTISTRIDGEQIDVRHLTDHELDEAPNETLYDVTQHITQLLNKLHEDDAVEITIEKEHGLQSSSVNFLFTNGRRGWEARREMQKWLQWTLTLMGEHDANVGPISTPKQRAITLRATRKHGYTY